ncbi:MAG: alpha/beta fold hydrolase [Firmicutes bacterium]|nr:alpha/beta fold hydrolase [Bacillota bacterium]
MRRPTAIILVLALTVLLLPAAYAATTPAIPADEGVFIITQAGQELGREQFTTGPEAANSVVELTLPTATLTLKSTLNLGPDGATAYSLDAGPGGRVDASFSGQTATLTGAGLQRVVELTEPRIVLENNVFAHYQVLLAYYDETAGGVQQFTALVPGTMAAYPVTLERKGPASGDPSLIEYHAVLAGTIGVIITADEQGRVMSINIPVQAVSTIRESYKEEQEKAALPAAIPPDSSPDTALDAPGPRALREVPFEAQSSDAILRGTITLPADESAAPYPAVVLISGSGPQDRDGNTPPSYMTFIFRDIAERLASAGIAVARYDERGVGESEGDLAAAALHGLMDDARAVTDVVRAFAEIDSTRVALAGHSEGAYIAAVIVASASETAETAETADTAQPATAAPASAAEASEAATHPPFAAVALLAGASTTLDKIMIEQLDYQANHPDFDEATRATVQALRPEVEALVAAAASDSPSSDPNVVWLRQHMELEPLPTVARITCPILIVQGEKDVKVMPYHARALAEAAQSSGNADVRLVLLPNTTHEFLPYPINNPDWDPMRSMQVTEGFLSALESFFTDVLRP